MSLCSSLWILLSSSAHQIRHVRSTSAVSGVATAQYTQRCLEVTGVSVVSEPQSNIVMLKNVYRPISLIHLPALFTLAWLTHCNKSGREKDCGQHGESLHGGAVSLARCCDHLALLRNGAIQSVLVLRDDAEYLLIVSLTLSQVSELLETPRTRLICVCARSFSTAICDSKVDHRFVWKSIS